MEYLVRVGSTGLGPPAHHGLLLTGKLPPLLYNLNLTLHRTAKPSSRAQVKVPFLVQDALSFLSSRNLPDSNIYIQRPHPPTVNHKYIPLCYYNMKSKLLNITILFIYNNYFCSIF